MFEEKRFKLRKTDQVQKRLAFGPLAVRLLSHIEEYTRMAKGWRRGEIASVSAAEKLAVKNALTLIYETQELEEMWNRLEDRKTLDNPGLMKLVQAFGVKSKAFMSALSVAPSTRILRTALGLDVFGVPISDTDLFGQLMRLLPTFSGLNYRYNLLAREFLPGAHSVAIVACGDMLELMLMAKYAESLPEEIVACDSDPEVARWLMRHVRTFDVDFRCVDLFSLLKSLPDKSQDRILANGICSYNLEQLPYLLSLALSKMKPGGTLVVDLQIAGSHMEFNDQVLGWSISNFSLAKSVTEAVETMRAAADGLSLESADYYLHSRLSPFEVIFALKKASS